ncbi:hypothetical protein DMENIID0001_026050 [Sergentomyia squamirostris]
MGAAKNSEHVLHRRQDRPPGLKFVGTRQGTLRRDCSRRCDGKSMCAPSRAIRVSGKSIIIRTTSPAVNYASPAAGNNIDIGKDGGRLHALAPEMDWE